MPLSYLKKTLVTIATATFCFISSFQHDVHASAVVIPIGDDFFVIPIKDKPAIPNVESITATQDGEDSVTLVWPVTPGADSYQVELFNPDTGEWEVIYTGSANTFQANGLLFGNNIFRIRACDGNRCSDPVTKNAFVDLIGLTGPNTVGVLNGEGGVAGGTSSYQIPITVPPGRKGIQPTVSLAYSSSGNDGVVGVGWSLNAGQAIHRCGATVAQDGIAASVNYDSRDRLCLNGERLVIVSGAYGANGAEYRTEIDRFARIKQSGSINGITTSFTVESKDGMVSSFGISGNSRQSHAGRPQTMTWAIAESKDRSGNSLHYDYTTFGSGEHLLTAIHYTGVNSTRGNRHVRFTYEDRPDFTSRYIAGGHSRQTQRLREIKTEYGSEKVRTYTLDYGALSESSNRSLVRAIQECAYKGNAQHCTRPTNFIWQEHTPQFEFEKLQFKNSSGQSTVVHADKRWIDDVLPRGDVNGDGVRDWPNFYVNAEGEQTGTHNNVISNCYRRANSWTTSCLEADFDSDGLTDSFRRANGMLQIKYASSNSWINTGIAWPFSAESYPIGFSDFNGDGWIDIAFRQVESSRSGDLWIYTHTKNNAVPFSAQARTFVGEYQFVVRSGGASGYLKEYQIYGDMDGNGFADFIEFDTGINTIGPPGLPTPNRIKRVMVSNLGAISFSDQVFTGRLQNTTVNASFFHDLNGDGLVDWLAMANDQGQIHYKLNLGNGFSPTWTDLGLVLPTRFGTYDLIPLEPEFYAYPAMSKVLTMDYNGDGRQDLLVAQNNVIASSCNLIQQAPPAGPAWFCDEAIYGQFNETQFSQHKAQINSEILDDSVRSYKAFVIEENADGTFGVRETDTDIKASGSQHAVIDATGDGLPDVVTVLGCRFQSCEWNTQTGSRSGTKQDPSIEEGAYINRNRGASTGSTRYEAHDMLKSVTNGFGVRNEWVYRPLSSDEYDKTSTSFYQANHAAQSGDPDYLHFASSMYVVAEQLQSDGIGGLNSTLYRYRDAIYNNKGRGYQGFKAIITEGDARGAEDSDVSNEDVVTRSDYYQKWPLSGLMLQGCSWLANDNTTNDNPSCSNVISKTVTNTIKNVTTSGAARFLAPTKSTETRYKLSDRSLLVTIVEELEFDDFGNNDVHKMSHSDAYTQVSEQTNRTFTVNQSSWWLDRLESETITMNPVSQRHSTSPSIVSGTDTLKRTVMTYNSYDEVHRLPTSVTTTALGTSLTKTVTTDYTNAGLPKTQTTTGTNAVGPRVLRNTYSIDGGTTNSENGYFVNSVTNALNHVARVTTDPRLGTVLTRTDANGLVSTMTYDAFGRIEDVREPGLPIAKTRYRWCETLCWPQGVYKVTNVRLGSPEAIAYKDMFNRDVWVGSKSFGNRLYNAVVTSYNKLGQMDFQSEPFSSNKGIPTGATFKIQLSGTSYFGYDALGRPEAKLVSQTEGRTFETEYDYDGFKTNITATANKVENGVLVPTTMNLHRIRNGLDQLMETKDAINGITKYAYDGSGNPIVLQDVNGNKVIANYNSLGHKIYVDDPNMGRKDFIFNALGEVTSEEDANGDVLTYTYDKLSRMTLRRSNNVINGQWSYDNPAANKGIGLLDFEDSGLQEDGSKLRKIFEYTATSSGRKLPAKVTHRVFESANSFNDYEMLTEYDSTFSRVSKMTYPTGLAVAYDYNYNGYMTREKNALTNYVYQQVDEMNMRDQIVKSRSTNGALTQIANYSPETGQLKDIQVTMNGALRHSLEYLYDGFGDLHYRKTVHGIDQAEENFVYDDLHRVTKSTRDFTPAFDTGTHPDQVINYSYDGVGNLLSKTDYATNYTYNSSRPNAVSQVTLVGGGTVSFGYDMNGNMTAGHNKTIDYNVFNKPISIASNGSLSTFQYGADLMRYKKVETGTTNETTIYIDKSFEVIIEGNQTRSKTYIGSNTVVTEHQVGSASPTVTTRFLHKGRLGSTITITDEDGNIVETNGYDTFGKPRTGLWEDKTPATLDSSVTTRGFTGHEHLDESELIHMNGRAYDYNLGRFLSVDPFVQAPGNTQSMNPYSYLLNNPLAGTDPTGYLGDIDEEIEIEPIKETTTGSRIARETGKYNVNVGGKTIASGTKAELQKQFAGSNGGATSQGTSNSGANAISGDNSVASLGEVGVRLDPDIFTRRQIKLFKSCKASGAEGLCGGKGISSSQVDQIRGNPAGTNKKDDASTSTIQDVQLNDDGSIDINVSFFAKGDVKRVEKGIFNIRKAWKKQDVRVNFTETDMEANADIVVQGASLEDMVRSCLTQTCDAAMNIGGYAPYSGKLLLLNTFDNTRTTLIDAHEFGHKLGLRHRKDKGIMDYPPKNGGPDFRKVRPSDAQRIRSMHENK